MAKRMLLNVLVDYLGDYIDGLSEENLKLGVWSGILELHNLALNTTKLHNLNLPLNVLHGVLESLTVSIPWTSLDSSPVKVNLDGVFLVVGPVELSKLDMNELKKQIASSKQATLLNAEKAVETAAQNAAHKDSKDSASTGYLQRLGAKIADNIEITLKNIHIRYEDSLTIPGVNLSAGVTLDSFTVRSTDADWNETFVKRDASGIGAGIFYKLASLKNLGLYWNTTSIPSPFHSSTILQNKLKSQIFTDNNTDTGNLMYFLAVPNRMTLKTIHREHSMTSESEALTPKIEMFVESSRFPLQLEEQQYIQFMTIYNDMAMAEKQRQVYILRPLLSPIQDPKAWWLYAYKAMRPKRSFAENLDTMNKCIQYRDKYIALLKLSKSEQFATSKNRDIHEAEIREIEELLPIYTLITFRQLAMVQIMAQVKEKQQREAAVIEKGKLSSWMTSKAKSLFSSSSSPSSSSSKQSHSLTKEEDDVSLDSIEAQLQKSIQDDVTAGSAAVEFPFRLILKSSATLHITSKGTDVIHMTMAVSLETEVRATVVTVIVCLDDLVVLDQWTPTAVLPILLEIDSTRSSMNAVESDTLRLSQRPTSWAHSAHGDESIEDMAPKVLLIYEGRGSNASIKLTALPLIIAWNKPCLQKLLEMFVWSSGSVVSDAAEVFRKSVIAAVDTSATTTVILEADAPKIIIPDDVSNDRGVFYLDNGHLAMSMTLNTAGMVMSLTMSSINAAICDSVRDIKKVKENNSYLIRPFNFEVKVQDVDKVDSDMTVDVSVFPEIRGELHALGLERFIRVIENCIATISTPAVLENSDEIELGAELLSDLSGADARVVGDAQLLVDVMRDSKIMATNVNPFRVLTDVKITCPCVALQLPYKYPHSDHLLLALTDLKMSVTVRTFDMLLVVGVENLQVQESQRCEEQRNLVRTPPGTKLVHIAYQSCTSRLSPLFKGFATEINLAFSQLDLNVDPKTTLHLGPYYHAIINATSAPIDVVTDLIASTAASTMNAVMPISAKSSKAPTGMVIKITLGEVSVEFLRASASEETSNIAIEGVGSNDKNGGHLSSVCIVTARDFSCIVEIQTFNKTVVRLRSFEITDSSELRSDYVYRQILRPYNIKHLPLADQRSESDDNMNIVEEADLLTVSYIEEAGNVSYTEVSVRDIACLVSVDCILDLVDVAVANGLACTQIIAQQDPESTTIKDDSSTTAESSVLLTEASANAPMKPKFVPAVSHVHVSVTNPHLILLEDPTQLTSRALVVRGGIDVRFSVIGSTETSGFEENECLHISLHHLSLGVLSNMTRWVPQQIIDPFGLELVYKRTLLDKVAISMGLSLQTDDLNARISLNDAVLMHSILMRAALFEAVDLSDPVDELGFIDSKQKGTVGAVVHELQPHTDKRDSSGESDVQRTSFDGLIVLGTLSITLVNDFNAQNIPVIRALLRDTEFVAFGLPSEMEGSGSCHLFAEFYNSKIGCWEPVIEPFLPNVKLSFKKEKVEILVEAPSTLQISVSGQMTKTILQTYSQLLRLHDTVEREPVHPLTVSNRLGLPIVLLDGVKHDELLEINAYDTAILSPMSSPSLSTATAAGPSIPQFFDIKFTGNMAEFRAPLYRLPLNTHKTRCYYVQPVNGEQKKVKPVVLEPVVEEIVQNQRYDPLNGWKAPFIAYDPFEYTCANGDGSRCEMRDVKLPNDKWEWQGNWKVSMTRKVGTEIDEEGWDYGTNFQELNSPRGRRTRRPLDSVRRRLWYRTRVPLDKVSREDDCNRPWPLFWEVTMAENGSKQIGLFSRIRIRNLMQFSMVIFASGPSWEGSIEVCCVPSGEEWSVPISLSHATSLFVKPSSDISHFESSDEIDCRLSARDFDRTTHINCVGEAGCLPICATVSTIQREKAVFVTISPHYCIQNLLPCDLNYRLISDSGSMETGILLPGSYLQPVHTDPSVGPSISFRAGQFDWSPPCSMSAVTETVQSVPLQPPKDDHRDNEAYLILNICMSTKTSFTKTLLVFTELAVVDMSGLGLCVRGSSKRSSTGVRYTTNGSVPIESYGDTSPTALGTVLLRNLKIQSHRKYEQHAVQVGSQVHTDRKQRWIYLPDSFKAGLALSTPCDDRAMRSDKLIQFQVDQSSIVIVLFDIRVRHVPSWVVREGYVKLVEQAVSDCNLRGSVSTFHHVAYGKRVNPAEEITLGSNASRDSRGMYVVFVVGTRAPLTEKLLSQVNFNTESGIMEAKRSWADGEHGLGLFSVQDGKLCVGVDQGRLWSEDLPVSVMSSSKGRFEIIDKTANSAYQLSYSVMTMAGVFQRTKVVTVMPHYCIVNCLEYALELRQQGDNQSTTVHPWQSVSWHKRNSKLSTALQFKCESSDWSYGAVDINEVGCSVLLLPTPYNEACESSAEEFVPVVLHLEVKEAEQGENCYMTIVIWRARIDDGATLSIRNDSEFPVTVRQANVLPETSDEDSVSSSFDLCVWPGKILPFGWIDPQLASIALVGVGSSLQDSWTTPVKISLLSASENVQMLVVGAYATVQAIGRGRVLRIVKSEADAVLPTVSNSAEVVVSVSLPSVGLSLVVERPIRRELCSMYIDKVDFLFKGSGETSCQSFELSVYDFQIDNYADAARSPVFLYSAKRETTSGSSKLNSSDLPVLQAIVVLENHPGSFSSHFEYIGVRLLELVVQIDSGTLEQLICDMQSDMDYISWDEALASNSPEKWADSYNLNTLSAAKHLQIVNVYLARKAARANKMYFKNIMIHPLKISLTFQKSQSQRRNTSSLTSVASYWLEAIPAIIAVDRMPFKLNSFIVRDVLESSGSLTHRYLSQMLLDLQSQSAVIAGSYLLSLSVLGRPAGLVKNIGGGVQNFFYEPYEGALQSPKDFVMGIGKGTTGLVTSVVSGALTSTSSIVGTASDSISRGMQFISSDEDYSRKRHEQQQQRKLDIARGGAVAGFMSGGETIVTGIASGLTGLVSTPINEARKGGAVGFLKGVGLGVIGAAVKPVLGVTDGLVSITQGISNTVSNAQFIDQARPPRVLERLDGESSALILVPIDIDAISAQAFVHLLARKGNYEDVFYSMVSLPIVDKPGEKNMIILSRNHVIWRRSSNVWTCPWANISHVLIDGAVVNLVMYTSSTSKSDTVPINCENRKSAEKLYIQLYQNASQMGNPGACQSLEDVSNRQLTPEGSADDLQFVVKKIRVEDEYPFGTVNGTNMGSFDGNETQLLSVAKQRMALVQPSNCGHLDEEAWRIIWNWECTHRRLQSVRCCICVLLNKSDSSIQITRLNMREGRSLVVIPTPGYESESKTVLPGGVLVVFAYGLRPSVLDKAHIKFDLISTAFTATIATRVNRTECHATGSFNIGFLEKSLTEWWGKYVLLVK